jgi:hypothetical protein
MRKRAAMTAAIILVLSASAHAADMVRLKAMADTWLSDANAQERVSSCGKGGRFKLKSIQEMAAINFDAAPVKGREVLSARLFIHPVSPNNQLRYIRVSTITQDWKEGTTRRSYGPGSGATYSHADFEAKKPWAWPGSQFCDVIMTSGNSIACWAERKKQDDGWISVDIEPDLVYALAVGDTCGLAVMDGGTLALHNNMVHSRESGRFAPYIEVKLGEKLETTPAKPRVKAAPDPGHADLNTGSVRITVEEAKNVFCWRVSINGEQVDRWRVPHPAGKGPTSFYVDNRRPSETCNVEVVAVSRGGQVSPAGVAEAAASPALKKPIALAKPGKPKGGAEPPARGGKMRVWAYPGLVKVDPLNASVMFGDVGPRAGDWRKVNAVWDGRRVQLFGIRGEYVDFQLCVEKLRGDRLTGVTITPGELKGPKDGVIGGDDIELYKMWYSKNKKGRWQPAYCIPIKHGGEFDVPDPARGLSKQQNQAVYVDVYIPKNAEPGEYTGELKLEAEGVDQFAIPVRLTVHKPLMPDELAFWPEMNAYRIPRNHIDYWQLAQRHRCVANFWVFRPRLRGAGKNIQVDWTRYDRMVGSLLDGTAFKDSRRGAVPAECLYLPFADSWPTPLSKNTYRYNGHWPGKGQNRQHIIRHYLDAPYIGDALSQSYKDAFHAVQKQFVEHFKEKGWTGTEMQCFYGGKNTHRIKYGSNMWWTTDEPYHWDDWLALQFFCRHWTRGRVALGVSPQRWAARGDISRANWQGKVLAGVIDTVYYGGYTNRRNYKRCELIAEATGQKIMSYGGTNSTTSSNTQGVTSVLSIWLNGADGHLPWQTCGNDASLDKNDNVGGSAIFVPGKRFGLPVVADMRLKAFRNGEQIVEYLALLADKRGLSREQLKLIVFDAVEIRAGRKKGAGADNADALRFSSLSAWDIRELRKAILEELEKTPGG